MEITPEIRLTAEWKTIVVLLGKLAGFNPDGKKVGLKQAKKLFFYADVIYLSRRARKDQPELYQVMPKTMDECVIMDDLEEYGHEFAELN